jgi:periplasmic protein TonB
MRIAAALFKSFATVLVLLVSANALAQSADAPSEVAPLEAPYPSSVTPPIDIGQHICVGVYYPTAAIRMHAEGTTILSFVVTVAGAVQDIKVVTSSGNAALDDASIKCVLPWQFQPAQQNGKPVAVIKQASQVWRLRP